MIITWESANLLKNPEITNLIRDLKKPLHKRDRVTLSNNIWEEKRTDKFARYRKRIDYTVTVEDIEEVIIQENHIIINGHRIMICPSFFYMIE